METLAIAMARLHKEMQDFTGPRTFTATLDNATDFSIVSDAVEEVAQELNMYVGEKRWIKRPEWYELRVGYAPTIKDWVMKYGMKVRGGGFR